MGTRVVRLLGIVWINAVKKFGDPESVASMEKTGLDSYLILRIPWLSWLSRFAGCSQVLRGVRGDTRPDIVDSVVAFCAFGYRESAGTSCGWFGNSAKVF